MNLIERLGGYEKAENHRDYLIDFGNEFNRPNKYEVDKINNALLQYRREHGIYEVGDFVFYTGRANDADLYCLKEVYNEHSFAVGSNGADKDFWTLFLEEIRHATDAEIEAGNRLEVGDGSF